MNIIIEINKLKLKAISLINSIKTTDVTYTELLELITASNLKPNSSYNITDFQTVHYLVDSDGDKHGINTGTLEPLIVTALSINTLDIVAHSLLYPQDIIHYDWNSENYLTDEGFSTAGVIVAGFKGVIYFRHDTINNNQIGNDFRNVRSRRWESSPSTWNSGTTYGAKAYVKYNNWLYASFSAGNLNNTPALGSEFWVRTLDLSGGRYWNDNPTSTNGILSGVTYKDCLLFEPLTEDDLYINNIYNNKINSFQDFSESSYEDFSIIRNVVIYFTGIFWILGNEFKSITCTTLGEKISGNTSKSSIYFSQLNCLFVNHITEIFNTVCFQIDYSIINYSSNFIGYRISNCLIIDGYNSIFGGMSYSKLLRLDNNTIKNNLITNDIRHLVGCTIPSNFQKNNVEYASGINFTGATFAVANYECRIFRNSSEVSRLEYVNGSNVTVNVASNA